MVSSLFSFMLVEFAQLTPVELASAREWAEETTGDYLAVLVLILLIVSVIVLSIILLKMAQKVFKE
jgi:hypothetical protein